MSAAVRGVRATLAVATPVAAIQLAALLLAATLADFYLHSFRSPVGWTLLALQAALVALPLTDETPALAKAFVRFSAASAAEYFPTRVVVEDEPALAAAAPHLLAYEPHSALPIGMPIVFSRESPLLPAPLRGSCFGLASGICFWTPAVRHLYWWLGVRPASKEVIAALLKRGNSVVLCPGALLG